MGEAFDRASEELRGHKQPPIVLEIIARRIIEIAEKGERDPIELYRRALKALGIDRE